MYSEYINMKAKEARLKLFCRTERHKRVVKREKGHIPYHLLFGMALAVVLLFAGIGIVGATSDYYVATWGSDGNTGTSVAAPWQHPSYAAQQAQAGDTIYLIDGIWYNEKVVSRYDGNTTHPITIKAYNGTPTFIATTPGLTAFSVWGEDYWILDGFTIRDYHHAIAIGAWNHHISIYNMTINHTTSKAIDVSHDADYVTIHNNTINYGGWGDIYFNCGEDGEECDYAVVTNNICGHATHNAIDMHNNCPYAKIWNNTIINPEIDGLFLGNKGHHNLDVRYNEIYGTLGGQAINLIGVDNSIIADNYMHDNARRGILINSADSYDDPTEDNIIQNNRIEVSSYYDGIMVYKHLQNNNTFIDNNITILGTGDHYCLNNASHPNGNIIRYTTTPAQDQIRIYAVDSSSYVTLEFTDGRVFTEDPSQLHIWDIEKSIVSLNMSASDLVSITAYNITAVPASETVDIALNKFDTSLPKGDILVDFTADTIDENEVVFTVGDLKPNRFYLIKKDGFDFATVQADSFGYIEFNNSQWSEHRFTIEESSTPSDTGTISGLVTNTTGATIQGATVTVDGTVKSGETDANGIYTLTDVPINTYTVTCTAPSYHDSYQSNIAVSEGVTTTVNFALISSTITPIGDLVGEWHFDEGTEGLVGDSSGNGNNGTIHGTNMATGKIGTALEFDGLDDYVSIPDAPTLNPVAEITLSAWVNPCVIPQDGWNKIIAKPYTNYTTPWQQYALALHDNQFVFELNTEGAKDVIASTETLEPNTWYHVTGTYDGSEMRIYVNAALNGTIQKSGAIVAYPTDVHIGAGIYSDAETEYLNGTIDEVKIYSRALSAEEIRADYVAVSPVGEWHFDEGTEGLAVDSSGNGNNGTIHGTASWTAGKVGTALDFDGETDYVSIPNTPTLNPAAEITLSAWVNPGIIPQDGYRKIIAKPYTNYTSPWQQYALTLHDNQFVFELNTEGTKDVITSTETLEPNTWYHVTGTYDGSEMRIYVNAALKGTLQKSGNIAAYPTDVHIGAGIYSDTETEYINGTIDEVKIYSRALSEAEIQADYEAGLEEQNTLSGTVTGPDSTGLAGANVTLTTIEGTEINTTQTDSSGHYAFADVTPDYYNLTATKLGYWPDSDPVTVTADTPTTADVMLCMIYDFNTNSGPADAGDLAMMEDASVNIITPDWTYDLNGNGEQADASDLAMLKDASVAGVDGLE